MARVAVLADIHGNLPALDAVLVDVNRAGVDLIVLNGDLADGPMPVETLDRLAGLGERAVWIRGNTDRWLVDAFDGCLEPPSLPTNPPAAWFEWCAARLSREHRDLLADLPLSLTLDVDGLGEVRFCHATLRDDNEFILVDSPVSLFDEAFADTGEQTVVLGHTHMPFDRLANTRRFVNVGSVGLQYGHAGASWALLAGDVTLKRSGYDTEAAARTLVQTAAGLPGIGPVAENVRCCDSDVEALTAFQASLHSQQSSRANASHT